MLNKEKSGCMTKHIIKFRKENKFLNYFLTSHNNATFTSFVISLSISTSGYTNGIFLKECFDKLFQTFLKNVECV